MNFFLYLLVAVCIHADQKFDYFNDYEDMIKNNSQADNVIAEIKNIDCLGGKTPKISAIAIHGGKIEPKSDYIAEKVFDIVKLNNKAHYYAFISRISKDQSVEKIKTNNCCKPNKTHTDYNNVCPKTKDKKVKMCQPNALHITSTKFKNGNDELFKKLEESDIVVSIHGFDNENADDKKPVDVFIGGGYGKENLKMLAEKIHKALNGNSFSEYRVAYCYVSTNDKNDNVCGASAKKHCQVLNGSKMCGHMHLAGLDANNVVNKGKKSNGIHIELSSRFRVPNDPQNNKANDILVTELSNYLKAQTEPNLIHSENGLDCVLESNNEGEEEDDE